MERAKTKIVVRNESAKHERNSLLLFTFFCLAVSSLQFFFNGIFIASVKIQQQSVFLVGKTIESIKINQNLFNNSFCCSVSCFLVIFASFILYSTKFFYKQPNEMNVINIVLFNCRSNALLFVVKFKSNVFFICFSMSNFLFRKLKFICSNLATNCRFYSYFDDDQKARTNQYKLLTEIVIAEFLCYKSVIGDKY